MEGQRTIEELKAEREEVVESLERAQAEQRELSERLAALETRRNAGRERARVRAEAMAQAQRSNTLQPATPDETEGVRRRAPLPPISRPPTPPASPEPAPTPEASVRDEIENLPQEDREKLGWGLNTIGFQVEKKKNDFFASTFNLIGKGLKDKKGTTARFCKELQDSFVRDSKTAEEKARNIISGKNKNKLGNVASLSSNVLKYGRMVTDLTGKSLASPLRYVMMAGMAFARGAEAGKETRLKNEKVVEKTRIEDAAKAYEEAWAIYENAQLQEETRDVSAEALREAYLMNMPRDIQRRLDNPSTANSFLQKVLKYDMQTGMNFIDNGIIDIEKNKKLSPAQKKEAIQKLIKKYERNLKDFDRILTQYGTVDELAMAGYYAQTAGKTVVGALQVETLILSLEKLYEKVSDIVTSHHIDPLKALGRLGDKLKSLDGDLEKYDKDEMGESHARPTTTDTTSQESTTTEKTPEVAPSTEKPVDQSYFERIGGDETQPETETSRELSATTPKIETQVNPDAIVQKDEGITQAFAKQMKSDPGLAKKIGYEGDLNNKKELAQFLKKLAIKVGYMDESGHEIRVRGVGQTAYELQVDDTGHAVVTEKTLDGKIIETHTEGDTLEKDIEKHEYPYSKDSGAGASKTEISSSNEDFLKQNQREGFDFGGDSKKVVPDQSLPTENVPETTPEDVKKRLEDAYKDREPAPEPHREILEKERQIFPRERMNRGEIPGQVTPYNNGSPVIWDEYGRPHPVDRGMPIMEPQNPFGLPQETYEHMEKVHSENMDAIFPKDMSSSAVDELMSKKANSLFSTKIGEAPTLKEGPETELSHYLIKIWRITGEKPKGWSLFGGSPETAEEYIERALIKAAKMPGALEKLKPVE